MSMFENNSCPFPGLRPYRSSESNIFFGREREVEDSLSILQQYKLVTITGDNGSGKTSLIDAGLITKIQKGFSGQQGKEWSICKFRPGISPIENLSNSLTEKGGLYLGGKAKTTDYENYKKILESKLELGLVEIYKNSEIFEKKNLLIIIDQIEDLFKFKKFFDFDATLDDNLLFNIIYRTSRYKETPIYFVIAIDNEFISRLNSYDRFTELLNYTQYSIPNITQNTIQEIINNTFHKRNVQLSSEVIENLGESLKENPSYLPRVQFLFKRIYTHYAQEIKDKINYLDIGKINEVGGFKNIFNHEVKVFNESLNDYEKKLFEQIVRSMACGDEVSGKFFYQKIGYINTYLESNMVDVTEFIKKYKNAFGDSLDIFKSKMRGLNPNDQKILNPDDIITLKYNLFNNWKEFNNWVEEEKKFFSTYEENYEKAIKYPQESLLTSTSLQLASSWLNDSQINENWAKKYDLDFNKTVEYIKESQRVHGNELKKQEEIKKDIEFTKKRFRKYRIGGAVAIIFALFIIGWERHLEVREQEAFGLEMDRKRFLAIKEKEKIEALNKDILNLRERESINSLQRAADQRVKLELIEEQLLSQRKLISLQEENMKQSKILEDKLVRIKEDSIKANVLISLAEEKSKSASNSERFINLKDSLSTLLYTLNNTTVNDYDLPLLQEITISSIDLYERIKALGLKLNRGFEDDNLRQIGVNLIAKLNGEYHYANVRKQNLVSQNKMSLRALNISSSGKIATGGKSRKLYCSENNISSGIKPLIEIAEFKSPINTIEFLSENLISVGLENSSIWIIEINSGRKERVFHKKNWRPGKILKEKAIKLAQLSSIFQKEYYRGFGFLRYLKDSKALFGSLEKSLVKLDMTKISKREKDYYSNIYLKSLSSEEFITSMVNSEKSNVLYVATNRGNIIIFDTTTNKEIKLDNISLNLNNETAIDIEFYDDTVLIGTKEGSVFLYKYQNNNLLKYVGSKRANYSKVKDLLYDKDNVYVISNNGAIVIIPISNFINNEDFNNAKTPVSIMFGEGNNGNVIESFKYNDKKYFITADKKGNLVFWDLNLENTFEEIKRLYSKKFQNKLIG